MLAVSVAAVLAAAATGIQQPDTMLQPAATQPWMNKADPPVVRAKALLAKMTQAEKLVMLHGAVVPGWGTECFNKTTGTIPDKTCAYTGNIPANIRLSIPPLNMNDGPQGFRENNHPGTTTQFPSGLTVAAVKAPTIRCESFCCVLSIIATHSRSWVFQSWDVEVMQAWGAAMGAEFFAKGANVQLGPGLNVARVPNDGRNFEYCSGEDPFLGYHTGAAAVKGIQSQHVIANAKHYVNNNQVLAKNYRRRRHRRRLQPPHVKFSLLLE